MCNLEIASINSQRDTGGKVFSLLVFALIVILHKADFFRFSLSLFYSLVTSNLLGYFQHIKLKS